MYAYSVSTKCSVVAAVVALAVVISGQRAQAQPAGCGDPDAGSCFDANGTPFCDDAECCQIVCTLDLFCCRVEWDDLCVAEAVVLCAGCGDSKAGNCFEIHPTPFCDNTECCQTVCSKDIFCCASQWDDFCVAEAVGVCAKCGNPDSGSCFESNGTPFCDDADCCAIVCDIFPFCCDNEWDGACSGQAANLCGHPCQEWDLVPSGDIGIADLLFLLEFWNDPYVIGDLLDLLSFWGDCPPAP